MLVDKDAGQARFCILWVIDGAIKKPTLAPANREHRATRAPTWTPEGRHADCTKLTACSLRPQPAEHHGLSRKHLGIHAYVSKLPGSY